MPYVKAQDGTEIYYYDWGTGAPVVLIHGWPLTSASWEYQASVLAESGFRVIAYDRRGFVRSGWPYEEVRTRRDRYTMRHAPCRQPARLAYARQTRR